MTDLKKISAREALMNTLAELLRQKPFQKISVNELCKAAHVSRSAFYANFNDKYHLLSCCLERATEPLGSLIDSCPPREFLIYTLEQIQQAGRLFYHAFHSEFDEETMMILYRFFEQHLSDILNQKAAEGMIFPEPLHMVSSFYIGGLVITTLEWIRSGYRESKETVADCLCQLMKGLF